MSGRWNVVRTDPRPYARPRWFAYSLDCRRAPAASCACKSFPTHAEAIAYATTQARTEQEPCS